MNRKCYISNDSISLCEYIPEIDDIECYHCWQDKDTQDGYNYQMNLSFQEYRIKGIQSRFIAVVIRKIDNCCVGSIFISSEDTLPDLAIMIYKPFRKQGYGSTAFALGVKYCFEVLNLEEIYAGCYEHNVLSKNMLMKCGFRPHPQGNLLEKHYLTGEDIIQYDYILHR